MNNLELVPILTDYQHKKLTNKINNYGSVNLCWFWLGYIKKCGYGQITITTKHKTKKTYHAHRLIYLLEKQKLSVYHDLHHNCGNRNCVNPNHLEPLPRGVHLKIEQTGHHQKINNVCKKGHKVEGYNALLTGIKRVRVRCRKCNTDYNKGEQ